MKMREIMAEGESWLDSRKREQSEKLAQEWPDLEPGMFVQLDSWFGDVWAEITSTYLHWENPAMRSVSFYRYEKYGVSRKKDSAHFGWIRKFATRDQIDFNHGSIFTPTACYRDGRVVEWGTEPVRRDRGGYELHPTMDKPARP